MGPASGRKGLHAGRPGPGNVHCSRTGETLPCVPHLFPVETLPRARMDPRDTLIRILECDAPAAALEALLAPLPAGSRALWLQAGGPPLAVHPWGAAVPEETAAAALAASGPELRAVDGGEALLLPLRGGTGACEAVVLAGPAGALTAIPDTRETVHALACLRDRVAARRALEEERDTLRRRAEESEAMHVLGLAANRTLESGEVLRMVARFTRSLLGAHYVTVSAEADGRIRTLAAAGLRAAEDADDDPFAQQVAEAGKPLTLEAGPSGRVEDPFHAAEGMRAGLGVPLALFGETFGALVVGYRRPFEVTPRDERLALTLAGHAAVALSNARLHGALAERSAALERANEELRWSAAAKDRFFASVSHELRTPLNAILGYNALLLEGVVGNVEPEPLAFLRRAQRATENLLYLVNDVLDLSKMEAGKLELVMQPVEPLKALDEALSTVEPQAREKGLPIAVAPAPPLPVLASDPDRVRQILVNLLSNAVKFTDRGAVTVTVAHVDSAEEEGERRRWVEVRVSDTGPGIPPGDLERIFHEFEQVSGASARGGTGLGLPISRKLARLLGGELRVESEPGRGSTFVLRLPADG
jgi:signal transduction histidine kinase